MKSSTSTLNPYAASYIPLVKREVTEDKDCKTLSGQADVSKAHPNVDDSKLKGQQAAAAAVHASAKNSQEIDKLMDEDSEMDLAYLQMIFPGISDQSLADVYKVNGGDLDAAVDMLTHLECTDDLPDALDILHPEVPVTPGQCSSVKDVNVTGESSRSVCPTDTAVAT